MTVFTDGTEPRKEETEDMGGMEGVKDEGAVAVAVEKSHADDANVEVDVAELDGFDGVDDDVDDDLDKQDELGAKKLDDIEEIEPIPNDDDLNGFWQREAKRMSKSACVYLWVAMVVSIVLSFIAMTVGGFEANVDNLGWQSRGTTVSDRQTQLMMSDEYQEYLFYNGPEAWEDLLNNVQPGWEADFETANDQLNSRRLSAKSSKFTKQTILDQNPARSAARVSFPIDRRLLQESEYLEGCDTDWYFNTTLVEKESHLWPMWQSTSKDTSILDSDVMRELCESEEKTQKILVDNDLCFGCDEGCLPPYSPVLYARLLIDGGFQMTCDELSAEWTNYKGTTEDEWSACVTEIKANYDPNGENPLPETCPLGFSGMLVEADFDETKVLRHTSSIFATDEADVDALYEFNDDYNRGSSKIRGAYDTQFEDFNVIYTESAIGRDMSLACGSAFITSLAILIHTRSPFVTIIGLLQIILSFPLSFFVYTFIGQLDFFPFLNFIGVFVVFALGADDIFVAVDKWKNARLDHPNASTAYVAAVALPDAAGAMFLTTLTTAIAFFGTAICPVAPVKMFAIFCGLLIMFDYLMCVLLVFPALCIYDRRLQEQRAGCCISCRGCKKGEPEDGSDGEEKKSFIHRVLLTYYNCLHSIRWGLFAACLAALAISIYFATTLELPTSADVRVLNEDHELEQNYLWRQTMLSDFLRRSGGSEALVGFGLIAADTGNLNDPTEWSELVLKKNFDPAPADAQLYMANFCDDMFAQDFAERPSQNFTCPFDDFADWIEVQAASDAPDDAYTLYCGGASSIPVPEENFHQCMISWSQLVEDTRVLSYEDKVRIIILKFGSRVRWDSPFSILGDEFDLINDWMSASSKSAPESVKGVFMSSFDFWWYDTNGQMLGTAYGAAAIALGAAAAVILFSSRSFTLTLFATITIGYVLTSVTSTLVAIGWTLGFLESICFAILIGISVDFVIHFCHAYSHINGEASRHERTKSALIRMGPSILAAAITTVSAAIIMLFTIITFFQKFALILFMTIIQSTIGAFVVFLTLTDCIGPRNPTALIDSAVGKCAKKDQEGE